MPRSKRNKIVSLTKADKKGRVRKIKLVDEVRAAIDQYEHLYTFTTHNMRNTFLKELRQSMSDSRFFLGKNKVMCLAFGREKESEYQKNLHKVCEHLTGECGLLFSNLGLEEVQKVFGEFVKDDFARSGFRATEDVVLPAGPLLQFPFSMETHLRKLGMPTELKQGTIRLLRDYTVCSEGEALTPDQARILKLSDIKMAQFYLVITSHWSKGGFEEL
mmetsp:Transcript_17731/g.45145  ORF Transcript_17731/g.45145 Transcript_17731/m.45145 type:complete len:217 (-) Transcript_17731:835-1485(-)